MTSCIAAGKTQDFMGRPPRTSVPWRLGGCICSRNNSFSWWVFFFRCRLAAGFLLLQAATF